MFVLVADDEGPKLDALVAAVTPSLLDAEICTARSVRAALDILREGNVDILVLDMSLPTFDIAPGEQGGRPQNYGGIELLRYMDFYEISCPVVIVTQYELFPDKEGHVDLSSLASRLAEDHPGTFREIIYYGDETWKQKLAAVLQNCEA